VVLVFATSDKGGTGRSVTSSNVLYRRALQGSDVCYLDFDFGSPTAGALFSVDAVSRGTNRGGLHSYLQGKASEPDKVDIWTGSDRENIRAKPLGAGRLVLAPGDVGGGEFATNPEIVRQCIRLFLRAEEEFDLCLVDLSAGRSQAVQTVLEATAQRELRHVTCRWLVFHRWTRQHILAAEGLVYGDRGLLKAGMEIGHDLEGLRSSIRFVRAAVVDPDSEQLAGMRPSQVAWLRNCDRGLQELASRHRLGRTSVLGIIPLDPMLQWREQLISDDDVWATQVANAETVKAFEELARRLVDETAWETL
jgi:hypothetical protein